MLHVGLMVRQCKTPFSDQLCYSAAVCLHSDACHTDQSLALQLKIMQDTVNRSGCYAYVFILHC